MEPREWSILTEVPHLQLPDVEWKFLREYPWLFGVRETWGNSDGNLFAATQMNAQILRRLRRALKKPRKEAFLFQSPLLSELWVGTFNHRTVGARLYWGEKWEGPYGEIRSATMSAEHLFDAIEEGLAIDPNRSDRKPVGILCVSEDRKGPFYHAFYQIIRTYLPHHDPLAR